MSLDGLIAHAAALWLALALLLGVTELLSPGLFLIFFAIAAAVTGVAALALPDLPLWAQALSFAAWSGASLAIGRRWYRDFPIAASDPLLNDRGARLIGETVEVCEAIRGGRGRVTVGDGAWPARGPDAPAGTTMRVVGAQGATLVVAPLDQPALPD